MDGDVFYKRDGELMEETGLSLDELKLAKSKIKTLGFIAITLKGVPAVTNYSIDAEKLFNEIAKTGGGATNSVVSKPPTGRCQSHQLHNIVTENTTESSNASVAPAPLPTNTVEVVKQKAQPKKRGSVSPAGVTPAREDFDGFVNPGMAMEIWSEWMEYKLSQHKFAYKGATSMKLGVARLLTFSGGSIQKARAIIHDSMINGYKGFFAYKDEMSAGAITPAQKIPEDTHPLTPELQERYEKATEWFQENCHLCAGIRWLSKQEYERVATKDPNFILDGWKYCIPSTKFKKTVLDSLLALNQSPKWEKEKWRSVYEWLKKDMHDRIFPKQQ